MAVSDPMLLTLPSPIKRGFDFKTPHDFAGHRTSTSSSAPKQLSSPPPERSSSLYPPRKSPVEGSGTGNGKSQMSGTPQHSRNLPPPPPLSLPDPRGLQPHPGPPSVPQSIQSVLGSLPPPPGQWQGNEDSMRSWLLTRTEEERRRQEEERRRQEEERRRQEEEKSRQEHYRLEQRKIEQSMLQESLRAGVPPVWMPMLFIAISGSTSLVGSEVFQNYLSQILAQQPQIQLATSPESTRSVPHPSQQQPYGQQPSQSTPKTPLGQQPYPQFPGSASTAQMRGAAVGPSGPGRGQSFEMLPRLATGHAGIPSGSSGHPQSSQPQEVASPIYFHHWTPPTGQTGGTGTGGGNNNNPAPATPSGDFNNSPKKRKTTTSHPSIPPPSSRFSTDTGGRRTGHSRQRSDLSMRGLSTNEPSTRPGSSAADSTSIPEGQQVPQPHQWIQQHPSSSTVTSSATPQQQQQQQQLQQHQQQQTSQQPSTASRPGADVLKAEEHQAGDGGADRGGFGSRRSSQPHSSGRASEDVEMAER